MLISVISSFDRFTQCSYSEVVMRDPKIYIHNKAPEWDAMCRYIIVFLYEM